jgi:hypothetical protein
MAIDTYSALASAVTEWMARAGDTDILGRFPDLLKLHEQRMYYGAKEVPGLLPQFEPLRIREMETTDASFTLGATVAQPTGFLELIEASLNSPQRPLDIVAEGVLAGYRDQSLGGPRLIAVSGTNFRVKDDPGSSYTATLRYFKKLTTPTGSTTNTILTTYPSLYLNGCLMQAYLMLGDKEDAQTYAALYVAEVGGLNERRNGELRNATNVRMRVRGRTP